MGKVLSKGSFFVFFCLHSIFVLSQEIKTQEIWKGKNHAAFTSLVYHDGYFYCAFREAKSHVNRKGNDNGIIVVIRSKQGKYWKVFLSYAIEGIDLRDPNMSITPRGDIMLLAGGVKYENGRSVSIQSYVSFFTQKGIKMNLHPILFDFEIGNHWLWKVKWKDDIAYGFSYISPFCLLKSKDGIHYSLVKTFDIKERPTEADICFRQDDSMIAIIRRNVNGLIGVASKKSKYKDWIWYDCGEKLGGPAMISLSNDEIVVVSRSYSKPIKTSVFKVNRDSMCLDWLVDLYGKGGDCSYPGLVYKRGILYISYYYGVNENTSIYLSKLKCNYGGI
ncbi:hypothetical protein [Butyricimonas virosa]|jgi:hypothetical protein|uniref:hypothetical protein n=1 Tax=Butyricimonas virosa TaxID=544645 RepID=UPI0022E90AAB|nr:hypothetical protein [Butyricimonas virosa]MCI6415434.1 hypothetical protein [Butyricimonas virosa]